MDSWEDSTGFDWDGGNSGKNWEKYGVSDLECEEVFFNCPLIVRHDPAHSKAEERRFRAFGQTDRGRPLFIAFTVRRNLIRIISPREMTRRELRFYRSHEKHEET